MSDPWDDLCCCGHPMRDHILDWDLDPEVDCEVEGCKCPEFDPNGAGVLTTGVPWADFLTGFLSMLALALVFHAILWVTRRRRP